MTKFRALVFVVATFAIALVACPSPQGASSPSTVNQGASCSRTEDCVLVRGDFCNRCGSCPSTPPAVMTEAEIDRIKKTPECIARLGNNDPIDGHPPPPPNCGPCAGDTAMPTAHAACIDGRCAMRCSDQHVVGDKMVETEVVCH